MHYAQVSNFTPDCPTLPHRLSDFTPYAVRLYPKRPTLPQYTLLSSKPCTEITILFIDTEIPYLEAWQLGDSVGVLQQWIWLDGHSVCDCKHEGPKESDITPVYGILYNMILPTYRTLNGLIWQGVRTHIRRHAFTEFDLCLRYVRKRSWEIKTIGLVSRAIILFFDMVIELKSRLISRITFHKTLPTCSVSSTCLMFTALDSGTPIVKSVNFYFVNTICVIWCY